MFSFHVRALVALTLILLTNSAFAASDACHVSPGQKSPICENNGQQLIVVSSSCQNGPGGGGGGVWTWECTSEDQCPNETESWNPDTQSCEQTSCPGDQLLVNLPNGGITCVSLDDDDDEECEDVVGYMNGAEICNDDKNDCEESGGSYGCAGAGSNTTCGCFPPDDLPTCDGDQVIIITESGYVCSSPDPGSPPDPDDPDNDDIPNSEDDDDDNDGIPDEADDDANGDGVPDEDTDGDGVPNYVDTDIDGDGIPNNLDPDADGDGVNEDKTGTGPCDPTQKNYWECIGADKGESGGDDTEALNELGTKLDTLDGTLKDELGDANDSLDDLKQALDFSAKEMPGHISAPGSFGEVHSSFYASISNAPIITAFNSVSGIVPDTGGDCPPLDYDLTGTIIGTTVSTDIHCQLLEDSSSYIYSIMLVVYSVFGFRILTRA